MRPSVVVAALWLAVRALPVMAQDQPALPFEHWGACPFECCTYRPWVAQATIKVFAERRDDGTPAFVLHRGEWVDALTGVVVTRRFGITRVLEAYGPDLQPGDVVYTLHDTGEGNDAYWFRGAVHDGMSSEPWQESGTPPTIRIVSRPVFDWWVQIRNRAGIVGWTRRTDRFGNTDACG